MRAGKKVIFYLPSDRKMPSVNVRATCLADVAPSGWQFEFIYEQKNDYSKENIIYRIYAAWVQIIINVAEIRSKFHHKNAIVLIKCKSPLLILILRHIYRYRVFLDVNDAIHLREHLGRFSLIRAYLMMFLSNGIIFESPEYRKYWSRFNNKSVVIEDTAQFKNIYKNQDSRDNEVVWFGSPETSKILIDYINHLKKFVKFGYKLKLMGCDPLIEKAITNHGLKFDSVPKYNHEKLVKDLSRSKISFVPVPNNELYTLRGNLKAKFSMACGCLVIGTAVDMHQRIIKNNKSGMLFNSIDELEIILEKLQSNQKMINKISQLGNRFVNVNFSVKKHANKIVQFVAAP